MKAQNGCEKKQSLAGSRSHLILVLEDVPRQAASHTSLHEAAGQDYAFPGNRATRVNASCQQAWSLLEYNQHHAVRHDPEIAMLVNQHGKSYGSGPI